MKKFLDDRHDEISAILGEPSRTVVAYKRAPNVSDMLFKRRKFAGVKEDCNEDQDVRYTDTSQNCKRPRCMACRTMLGLKTVKLGNTEVALDYTLNCVSNNVIYFAQCRYCVNGFYIGQTWQKFSDRLSGHRADFNEGKEKRSALALHIKTVHNENFQDKLDNFRFGLILKADIDKLDMYEDMYIEKTRARIIALNRIRQCSTRQGSIT